MTLSSVPPFLKRHLLLCIFVGSAAMLFLHTSAAAQTTDLETPHGKVSLIAEVDNILPSQTFWSAIQFDLKEGWHIYWKNPGDSGLPPKVAWDLPEGFTVSALNYPPPERFPFGPFANFGHSGRPLLLAEVSPPSTLVDDTIVLRAYVEWLVCNENCIPYEGVIERTLSTAGSASQESVWSEHIRNAVKGLPTNDTRWKGVVKSESDELLVVQLEAPESELLQGDLFLFPEKPGIIEPGALQSVAIEENIALITAAKILPTDHTLQDFAAVFHIPSIDQNQPQAVRLYISRGVTPSTEQSSRDTSPSQLVLLIALAFLGGMILNLMPCVFPVLSIKILGFVKQAAEERSVIRWHGFLFALGVLISMWALAGMLLLLRAGGEQVGWGFQLQSPLVITALSMLFFLIGIYFLGSSSLGNSLVNLSGRVPLPSGYAGSFMTGLLTTVIATPCTAPFMGSALGAALVLPYGAAFGIFTALGFGIAAPYLLLSLLPQLLHRIPRPGSWMVRMKEFMAFPMFASSLWLLSVLNQQVGGGAVVSALLAFLTIAFGVWLFALSPNRRIIRAVTRILSVCFVIAGVAAVLTLSYQGNAHLQGADPEPGSTYTDRYGITWTPYSEDLLAELRVRGTPVLLDFTAAWCITCQVNKRLALSSDRVQTTLQKRGFVLMQADWTNRSPEIARAIENHGRTGVPLNVLYGSQGQTLVLPTVLSPGIILEALDNISKAG